MAETKNILKFDPRLGLEKHLTGESGCANCSCKITWSNSQLDKKGEWVPIIPDKEEDEELDLDEVLNCIKFEPKKTQTIRRKPAKVGDKYEIWSILSGMEKGFYCPNCLTEACLTCKGDKLFNVEITECIDMKIHFTNKIEGTNEIVNSLFIIFPSNAKFSERTQIRIPYNTASHPFVKADMPESTNAQFIDFLLKYNPKIKEGWAAMYLWKFRRIE